MSISLVQATSNAGVAIGSISLAYGSNVTAGNLLVCAVSTPSGKTVSSVTDTRSNSWISVALFSGATETVAIWYAVANASGSNTVTATATASTYQGIAIAEYSGTAASPYDSNSAGAGGTGTAGTAGSVAVNNSNELVVGCFCQSGGAISATGASGYTVETQQSSTPGASIYYADQTGLSSASTPAVTFASSCTWAGVGVSFKPAGSTSPPVVGYDTVGSDYQPPKTQIFFY